MYPLKQSTAITVPVFAHDENGDAVTGLTNGSFTKRISKNGAAFGAMTVTITEMENGWYSVPLSTSHTDTLGVLSITLTSTAKQINLQFRVHARIYDDLAFPNTVGRGMDVDATGGVEITANQDVNVAQWNGAAVATPTVAGVPEVDLTHIQGGTQTVTDLKDFADAGYDPATNKVEGVKLVDTTTANTDMRGTENAFLAASAPANFSSMAITVGGAVTVGTNNDKTGYSIDTNNDKTGYSVDTVNDKTGYALSAAGVDAIWDEPVAGHTTPNTFGDFLDIEVSSRLAPTTAGRTLDVTTGGAAGIDWANVEGAGSTVSLTATTVNTVTTNTDMRGTDNALLASAAPTNFGAMAITVGGAVTVGTNNDKTGYTVDTNNDKTGYSISGTKTTLDALNDIAVNDIFTTNMTESYAADNAAFNLQQFAYMAWSALAQFDIETTTITCRQIDGTTQAMTFTTDSDTAPTSRTRAS